MNKSFSQPLPFWLSSAFARQRASGDWVVKLYPNNQGVGRGEKGTPVIVKKPELDANSAIRWAMSTPTGRKVRLEARGCHILAQIKAKFSPETRAEILRDYAAHLRAKYDGEHYLYESEDGQNELIQKFGLSDIIAANFPKQLCAA